MSGSLTVGMPISSFLPSLGGAEVGLHNIASRLAARGHTPVVIAPAPHSRALGATGWSLPYRVETFPPKVWGVLRHVPTLGYAILDRYLARLDRRDRVDIWHGTVGYPTGTALIHYAAPRGRPHLVRCVGEDIQIDAEIGYGMRLNPRIDQQIRTWLPRADRLVAITQSVADEYAALGAGAANIARIPNGVDLDRFAGVSDRRRVRASLGIPPDGFLFLCVGRNHPKKNFSTLLRAFAHLPANYGTLALVGAGVEDLNPLSHQLGVSQRVHLIGELPGPNGPETRTLLPADALVDLYRSADAFVFPSRLETFGIVLVEAMAARLPIITTDAPGCRDIVRPDIDGLRVTPDDVEGLASAMRNLHDDAELHRRLADAARVRAEEFSWDRITDSYVSLYRELIDARSNGVGKTAA